MPQTELFKENVKAAGMLSPNDIIKFSFELNENVTEDQILYIEPDCAICTKAVLRNGRIDGTVDLSKVQTQYNAGNTPINKIVIVYLNDGKPEYLPHPKTKVKIKNKDKRVERLNIASVVVKT